MWLPTVEHGLIRLTCSANQPMMLSVCTVKRITTHSRFCNTQAVADHILNLVYTKIWQKTTNKCYCILSASKWWNSIHFWENDLGLAVVRHHISM